MVTLLVLVGISVLGSVLVAPLTTWALATMAPSRAVLVGSAASFAAALGTGASLSALAIASLAGWGPIAREGHVSTSMLRSLVSVPSWVGASAALLVLVLLGRAGVATIRIGIALARSAVTARALAGSGVVAVVDDADIRTIAGFPGRIVLGSQLYERLSPDDRRVVLAHEHSHLGRRHHLYVHAADIAAAADPLLRGVRDQIRLGIERWADEDAAAAVADRDLAARALARVALQRNALHTAAGTTKTTGAASTVFPAATLQVSTRVRALLGPEQPSRTLRFALIALVAAIVLATGVAGLAHVDNIIEAAQFPRG